MSLYSVTKRIIDIIGAIVGLTLFSPFLIFAALWIKVMSPDGPIFLEPEVDKRVGKDGKAFKMYKFRTMMYRAQEWLKSQPELYKKYQENGYKLDPDPRWIKGAKFLRKTSIDEMPQFINVLKGDMSLVGYRAYYAFEVKEQLERYPEAKQYLEQALKVKPGVTGVWQTSGRSEVGFLDRVKMDAEYAKKKSIIYDIMIILKTPFAVISGKGAF